MSNKSDNHPTDLSQLYQRRKARSSSPSSIKRKIMEHEVFKPKWHQWFSRTSTLALGLSTLLLIGLVYVQHTNLNQANSTHTYTMVEIHNLAPTEQPLSEHVRHRYAQHYNDYLKQKQVFAMTHHKPAIIEKMDGEWALTTCQQELVKISDELIQALRQLDSIDTTLREGDAVQIAFDQSGIILGITRNHSAKMC